MPLKIQVPAEGPRRAKLMLIGEAPGRDEVLQKRPFVGRAGRFLDKALAQVGLQRKKLYITNVVKFRPTMKARGKITNRPPTRKEIETYRPLLWKEISEVRPKVAVMLGKSALFAALGLKHNVSAIHGRAIRRGGVLWLCTYHPANAMRNRKNRAAFLEDLRAVKKLARMA